MIETRAISIKHAEFAVLQALLDTVDLASLERQMVTDPASVKRFDTGAKNILKIIEGLADRRKHLLPLEHPEYTAKEESE